MDDKRMTTQELCEWLEVSKAAVSIWRKEGMPYYGGGKKFIHDKSEVIEWLKANKGWKFK